MGGEEIRRKMEGVNLTKIHILSTFVNVTMYPWYSYNMLINFLKRKKIPNINFHNFSS
jgi:hypothetical protein